MPTCLTDEAKNRLIQNGAHDKDGRVNMDAAERLAWAQKWRDEDAERAAWTAAHQRMTQLYPPPGGNSKKRKRTVVFFEP